MLQCGCLLLALSWLNLPCALKAAIGNGKRTLGALASLPRAGGRSKTYCGPNTLGDEPRPIARRNSDESLPQPQFGRAVGHEPFAGLARGKPPAAVFGIEKPHHAIGLCRRKALGEAVLKAEM